MNKERDPEKEREISARIAKASAKEKEIENRHKLVEEDRLCAEASGSALHKDQSRYEKYLYVPPHQRMVDSPEEEYDGNRRRGVMPRVDNGFSPLHDDRDRVRGGPRRGGGTGGRRGRGGRRGGGGGRSEGGHFVHEQDRRWRDERVQADTARLDANKTADGQWKREFDRGKKIPFASTRQINDEANDRVGSGHYPSYSSLSNRGRGRGGPRRNQNSSRGDRSYNGRGQFEGEDRDMTEDSFRSRQITVRDDAMMVTVSNDRAGSAGGHRGGGHGRSFRGHSRSSESSADANETGGARPRPKVRRSGDRRWQRRGRRGGHRAGDGETVLTPNGRPAPEEGDVLEDDVKGPFDGSDTNDYGAHISDGCLMDDAEVEDEYIDDTLEDLEDLDQYRLKIDLNEFTVDNPDLPDPILKKPMEFSWARAVSEEEKCQARGESAPQYSGPVEVVWYDEMDGERCANSAHETLHRRETSGVEKKDCDENRRSLTTVKETDLESDAEKIEEPHEKQIGPSEESVERIVKNVEPSEEWVEPSEEEVEPSVKNVGYSEESDEPSEENGEPSEESVEPSEENVEPSVKSVGPSEENVELSEENVESSEVNDEPSELGHYIGPSERNAEYCIENGQIEERSAQSYCEEKGDELSAESSTITCSSSESGEKGDLESAPIEPLNEEAEVLSSNFVKDVSNASGEGVDITAANLVPASDAHKTDQS